MAQETKAPKKAATPRNRKFDSLAWLIQESEHDCGAVWFDGKEILLATNAKDGLIGKMFKKKGYAQSTPLIDEVIKYIVYVAKKSHKVAGEIANPPEGFNQVQALKELKTKCKEKERDGKKFIGIERSTFLIDRVGVLRQEWRDVKVPEHAQKVFEAVKVSGMRRIIL